MTHRHWFPVIAAGSTLALIIIIGAVQASREGRSFLPQFDAAKYEKKEPAQDELSYQQAVNSILAEYRTTTDATSAYDTLLLLDRIPASMKDVHIGLVAAFGMLLAYRDSEAEARFRALVLEYPWLTL